MVSVDGVIARATEQHVIAASITHTDVVVAGTAQKGEVLRLDDRNLMAAAFGRPDVGSIAAGRKRTVERNVLGERREVYRYTVSASACTDRLANTRDGIIHYVGELIIARARNEIQKLHIGN